MNKHSAPMGLLALTAAACLCTLINVTGCGGGSSPTGEPQQGTGSLPGQQQGQNGGSTGGNGAPTGPVEGTAGWGDGFYTAQPITGTVGGSAPLGTLPEYG